jgi:hypothetical protein
MRFLFALASALAPAGRRAECRRGRHSPQPCQRVPRPVTAIGILLASIVLVADVPAQVPTPPDARRLQSSRAELEALVAQADSVAARTSDGEIREQKRAEAAALRQRLIEGDFHVGDRIILAVANDSALTDTFTVRTGKALTLPNLPDISLQGVLRAELHDVVSREIGKYVKDPRVQAKALIRLQVSGPVGNPGFHQFESDILLSDAIMQAGGPGANADLNRTVIKREGREVLSRKAVQQALTGGATLDQLNLKPGDEIVVPVVAQSGWRSHVGLAVSVTTAVLSIYYLSRRF